MADDRTDQAHAVDQTEHTSALPIGTHIGRYRIEAVLGQGAFGITIARMTCSWSATSP